ncbi:TonB-dependent receptor [Massilibacteroides vaginae]|uniref:TonB-dependent receptor n=1 Tax=Massilibacteroides vaginae TaxID=1673718 RepID=UPI001FE97BC2|nr:TonB-dependent receptor [Massilibacteroides vaginae]
MRLSFFLMLIAIFQLSAKNAYSQSVSLSFTVKNISIEEVLDKIEQETEFSFLLLDKSLETDKLVSIQADRSTVEQILTDLFESTNIQYKVVDRQIILMKKVYSTAIPQQKNKRITGEVLDERGEPIIGANIVEKGTTNGTITDIDGRFSLEASASSILLISYIGYDPIEVQAKDGLSIRMKEDLKALDEVVVIGYGSAKKSDLTGAISSIKTENIAQQGPRNVQDILRANAAGLNIGLATDAKAEASMAIRGKGTLASNSDPLIVLDGVIYEGALADINPQDISSVDILKDASSAAVYGAKAANGVIVFTTKKGKTGKPIINANANIAIAQSASQPKILDATGFMKFRQDYNEGRNSDAYLAEFPQIFMNPFELNGVNQLDWYNYDQKTPVSSVTDEQLLTQWLSRLNFTTPEIQNYLAGKVTKWDDLVFQTALQQDYTVSVSNATDYTSQYISLNWVDREGIIDGDKYQTFRARVNVESKVTPFLTVGVNAQYAYRNESFLKSLWGQMTMIPPYASNNIDDPESLYQRRPTGLDPINPFYDNLYTDLKDVKHNINAKLYALLSLPFGIEYTLNFIPYYHFSEYFKHYSSKGENWKAIGGESTRQHSKRFNWQVDNIINWKKEFLNQHKIEVTLLANAEKAQYWYTEAHSKNYTPNDVLGYHRLQAGGVPTVSSNDTYQTGDAQMGRFFYSFDNKYMLTASVRRDGFSAFGKKNPHAVFPAVALGWVFTQEKFMKKTEEWLNYAKLRFSWGENGNREIGQYAALAQMVSGLRPYIDQTGTVYTTSQIYVNTMANYNLKWERTASYNLGLDFSVFNDLLSGSLELYTAKTNDLLVNRALPNITGFSSVTSNLGQLQNRGMEVTVNANIINNKDFSWTASGNFSFNRRKINKLYGDMVDVLDEKGNVLGQEEANDETNEWFIGQDPDRIWSYERNGVWQLDEKETAAIYGCQPGDFKYIDQNNDGIMNNKDKVFQGYKTPRFRWTLRNEVKYKDFSFSALFYSFWNYYASHQRAANNHSFPDRSSDYDFPRWTSTNPINDYARIGSKNLGTNWVNKSFIRLENISLSYNVPKEITQRVSVQNLRLSMSVQNPLVWAPDWDFWDPEGGSVTPRTFTFGISVTL